MTLISLVPRLPPWNEVRYFSDTQSCISAPGLLDSALSVDVCATLFSVGGSWQNHVGQVGPPVAMVTWVINKPIM